ALRPTGAGEDAEVDLRLPELCGLRGDDQIARHRELAAAAQAVAAYCRDQRRAHVADRVPAVEAPALVERDRGSGGELADVSAGCERALVSTEHDAADRFVGIELLQRLGKLAHQLARERVQLLRPVEEDDRDRAVAFE